MGGATVAPDSWCDADMPTKVQVQAWLDAYVAAWRSYERDAIVALFTDDVSYAYHPYDEPLVGAEAVAGSWLAERDEPGTWEAEYAPALLAGDEVIATGETRYTNGDVFSNLWQLTFAPDGRCSRFVEWYLRRPEG
jgi:ketosteroid isomerase-like protein